MEEFIRAFYEKPEHKAFLEKLYTLGPEAQGRLEHFYLMTHCPEYRQEMRLIDVEAQMQPALYHGPDGIGAEPSQDGQERALDAEVHVYHHHVQLDGKTFDIDGWYRELEAAKKYLARSIKQPASKKDRL